MVSEKESDMKHLVLLAPISAFFMLSLTVCSRETSMDTSLFTVDVTNDIRLVHNHAPQLGDAPGAKLELIGKIGKLEGEAEEEILYDPVDVARLSNGDILILERDGCSVKRYNKAHEYISSFGQRGQGPGDFLFPFRFRLNTDRDKLYIAGLKISILFLDGSYEEGFKPETIAAFGSIGAQYKTSGMAILSGSRVILPSHPSLWLKSGEDKLLSVYDRTGSIIRSFGAIEPHDNPELMVNANIVYFTADEDDHVYLAYGFQNRINKYSADGHLLFSADRPLPYEVKNVMKVEVFKSGNMEREFPWPSVSSVSRGVSIDQKGRIWVLTYLKQPNRFLTFDEGENLTDCYVFEVFDSDGILLYKVPFPDVRVDNFSLCDDRLYIIDSQSESCVYEFRIIEGN